MWWGVVPRTVSVDDAHGTIVCFHESLEAKRRVVECSYMAAFRIKGVVRPQHAPTIRKPRIQRKTEGWGSVAMGVSGSIAGSNSFSER
jgi:hypothetical protein